MKFFVTLILLFPTLIMAHLDQDLQTAYQQKGTDYQPRTRHLENGKAKFTNHLILANSPYLLQHAHNPVNWYGFSDEAFKLAKQQNKLIFLSIGYATCHWCHVMEEESFEDLAVAQVLNKNFIAIKVDREVLPDVDSHFMDIAQLLTGSGGWPLNVVLTPAGDGFFAGTYFPKNTLISNLRRLQNVWQYEQNLITKTTASVKLALLEKTSSTTKLPQNLQSLAVQNLLKTFDEFDGGFSDAPKFPHESQLLMLIDEQMRHPSHEKLIALTTTLDTMASGGFYDVVAGDFHRYATDNAWAFPHFEKMLYNQAQLAMVYSKAYQLTHKPLYKHIAKQTLDYAIGEMQHKNQGFYSATDADSNGEEGLFFIWSRQELASILGDNLVEFERYFDLSHSTEFEQQYVIRFKDINQIQASDFIKIDALLAKLYQARQHRKKPPLDNKILLSWNALLLKALVMASEIDKKYLLTAQNLADFLLDNFYQNDLKRVQIDSQTSQVAIFEDYAYFADGLIDLYDATGHKKYLTTAQKLTDEAIRNFWDKQNFGFKISNNKRISNNKEIYDGAIFSANGVAYGTLNKLSARTQDKKYQQLAQQLLSSFSTQINQAPSAHASIVKNYSNKQQGALTKTVYAYDGRIKIQSNHNQVILNIEKGWHINANKVLQKSSIATQLLSDNIKTINYPQAKRINLGFSQEKLAVYDEKITFNFSLKDEKFALAKLTLQACSDKVCLPPQQITLLLN